MTYVGRNQTVSRPNVTHKHICLCGAYIIFVFVLVFVVFVFVVFVFVVFVFVVFVFVVFVFVVFVFVVFVFAVFVFVGRDQRVSRSKNSLGKYHICGVLENLWHGFINLFGWLHSVKMFMHFQKYKRVFSNF